MDEVKYTAPWSINRIDGNIIDAGGRTVIFLPVKELESDFAIAKIIVTAVNNYDALLARNKKLADFVRELEIAADDCAKASDQHLNLDFWRDAAKRALAENKEQADVRL